ncbi:MAG: ABC transporter ATP-binding protein [Spirochaetes bacterium]|nr:ABC transporter ATP-binding protein [Spirochaetota bacterium]MBN2769395.1 ABC transporter ATP-binding protein [Spirochaetota bacterium]
MKCVETNNLTKKYCLNDIVVNALQGVTTTFDSGEFTAIAGPSGSGKSTLLHLIGCLDTPSEGSIHINQADVREMNRSQLAILRRQSIGFIFQAYNLIPVLSALENVSLPLILLGADKKQTRSRSLEVLKQVGLADMQNRRPSEMSGGQQQRVAIARALVKKPSLILADEPTANLDSKTGRDILELMYNLNKTENSTFIFSTHDNLVMEYARRIIKLRDGLIDDEVLQ